MGELGWGWDDSPELRAFHVREYYAREGYSVEPYPDEWVVLLPHAEFATRFGVGFRDAVIFLGRIRELDERHLNRLDRMLRVICWRESFARILRHRISFMESFNRTLGLSSYFSYVLNSQGVVRQYASLQGTVIRRAESVYDRVMGHPLIRGAVIALISRPYLALGYERLCELKEIFQYMDNVMGDRVSYTHLVRYNELFLSWLGLGDDEMGSQFDSERWHSWSFLTRVAPIVFGLRKRLVSVVPESVAGVFDGYMGDALVDVWDGGLK